ncbi:MAG: hypothetical protein LBS00_05155 [Synergistaceae bacterium]|nr:hypothetical protein [Synergistaceae bacterium]
MSFLLASLAEKRENGMTIDKVRMILGIDPGRDKIGWALTTSKGELALSGICRVAKLENFLNVLKHPVGKWEKELVGWMYWKYEIFSSAFEPEVEYVALGDGTGNRKIAERCARFGLKVIHVGEEGTTMAARELYWCFHRPAWWQRCLPRSLRVPPRNVDDFAAWAIVLRDVAGSVGKGDNKE